MRFLTRAAAIVLVGGALSFVPLANPPLEPARYTTSGSGYATPSEMRWMFDAPTIGINGSEGLVRNLMVSPAEICAQTASLAGTQSTPLHEEGIGCYWISASDDSSEIFFTARGSETSTDAVRYKLSAGPDGHEKGLARLAEHVMDFLAANRLLAPDELQANLRSGTNFNLDSLGVKYAFRREFGDAFRYNLTVSFSGPKFSLSVQSTAAFSALPR